MARYIAFLRRNTSWFANAASVRTCKAGETHGFVGIGSEIVNMNKPIDHEPRFVQFHENSD